MLLRREATAQRDKRRSKSHILDQNPSFGVRRTVIYIFKRFKEIVNRNASGIADVP